MPTWNFSTALRNPNRIEPFAKILKDFVGKLWTPGSGNQAKFQIKAIQNRLYLSAETEQIEQLTYQKAKKIFQDKNYASGPDHRGRMSLSVLSKLGLCFVDHNNILRTTILGERMANGEIDLKVYFENVLLKYQLPQYATDRSYPAKKGYGIIPLLGTLQLINKVNQKEKEQGKKAKGISKYEFDIFIPTLIHHNQIDNQVKHLLKFRREREKAKNLKERLQISNKYKKLFADKDIQSVWNDPNNADVLTYKKTLRDYGDNILRYFRLSDWISLRGNGFYIDLNERKKIENESLLRMPCSPLPFDDDEEYSKYLADPSTPKKPWKSIPELIKKYFFLSDTITEKIKKHNIPPSLSLLTDNDLSKLNEVQLETETKNLVNELQRVDEIARSKELLDPKQIAKVIESLENIGNSGQPALELEHQTALALTALDDGQIKPNYPLGDDGEPTNTAPGGAGDIESFYNLFQLLTEVTMLTNRNQQYQEGDPVTRHFVNFAKQNSALETYCLFLAPKLHEDTLNQFYFQNVHYRGKEKETRIIPLNITQFIEILKCFLQLKEKDPSYKFSHETFKKLFDSILDSMDKYDDPTEWYNNIQSILDNWKEELLSNS